AGRAGAARHGLTATCRSPAMSHGPHSQTPRRKGWRAVGVLALAAVLGLAFWGYTTPEMQIHWENLAALCGF
ncbi:hypothetical protein BMR85_028335, partial [Achromobacter sp. KAs 3-5]